jgi:hypothetical protein
MTKPVQDPTRPTLTSLLEMARENVRRHLPGTPDYAVCARIIDLLAEAQPCGMEDLEIHPTLGVGIPLAWADNWVSPDDARHMARMLLLAADLSEEKSNAKG